jgi:hypothetical protein
MAPPIGGLETLNHCARPPRPPLLHRLFEGADTRSLADWISRERTSHFGAGPDDARDMRLAESLTAWWERRRAEAS